MKVYKLKNSTIAPLKKTKFKLEKEIQKLTEENLEEIFGLIFVETEFQVKNLRIDTLAYNPESNSFVIIEYKNKSNNNVVDQGYAYLSLLLNNKADFILRFNRNLKKNYDIKDMNFAETRILFISPSFNNYQIQATNFKDIAFELYTIEKYNDIIIYNNISKTKKTNASIKEVKTVNNPDKDIVDKEIKVYTEEDVINNTSDYSKELYEIVKEKLFEEIDNLEIVPQKLYINFKNEEKILLSIEPLSESLKVWLNVKPGILKDSEGLTRDVSNIGHHGVGNYDLKLTKNSDLDYFMYLVKQAL